MTIQDRLIQKFNIDIDYYRLLYQRVLVIDAGYILCGDINKYTDLFDVNGNNLYKIISWIGQTSFKQRVRKDDDIDDIATIVEYSHEVDGFSLRLIVIEDFWNQQKNLCFDENGMSLVWDAYDEKLSNLQEIVDGIEIFKRFQDNQALCSIRTTGMEGIQTIMRQYYTALYDVDRLYILGVGNVCSVNIEGQINRLAIGRDIDRNVDKYSINLISHDVQWNIADRWRRYQPGLKTTITFDRDNGTRNVSNITSNQKKVFIDTVTGKYGEERYNEY